MGCCKNGKEPSDYIKFGDYDEAYDALTAQNLNYVICGQAHVSKIKDCRNQQTNIRQTSGYCDHEYADCEFAVCDAVNLNNMSLLYSFLSPPYSVV